MSGHSDISNFMRNKDDSYRMDGATSVSRLYAVLSSTLTDISLLRSEKF